MARQDVLMEPQSPGSLASPSSPGEPSSPELPEPSPEMPPSDKEQEEEAAVNPDRKSSSSSSSSSSSRASSAGCVFHVDAAEMSAPLVLEAPDDDDDHADAVADAKRPDEWASWLEPSPPKTVDDDPLSSDSGTVSVAPESQTMAKPAPAVEGFNPDRIPASIFQPKTSSSQQEWSIASNESLFSIHGASQSQSDDFYAPSRSHFDYFYDEAMAAGASAEPDWKLPPLAEVSEHGGTVPGSAVSDASDGSVVANRAFRRHESGSVGSSSNFSFAFPILAEPSPGQKENMGGYQQLEKEHEQSPPTPSDCKSAFEEMTTEEERRQRKTGWCWCGECCGCCWFACSWSTCCCCLQWRWNCCSCSCSCPSLCRCSWCL